MQDFCIGKKVFYGDFLFEKHVNYLLKSLKKSTAGTPPDVAEAHRLSSLFFVVSGLDLLDVLDSRLSHSEKNDIIEWIYSYQVDINKIRITEPVDNEEIYRFDDINDRRVGHSGFRSTSMINSDIPFDCGTISMTYCALATLVILGDHLKRVDRSSIIAGIRHIQLPDGSFKPSVLGGESDMRLVYCAVAVSRILNDWSGIDKENCAKFIKESLSYEGAFAQCPGAEAHGGSTYCALASLKMMSKLEDTLSEQDVNRLIRWCMNRIDHGFSGRPNKEQDTCYSFWIGASLVMLKHFKFVEQTNLLEFILLAQEERGGLSKVPGFYSDPLHTYLGFAGLTFVDEDIRVESGIFINRLDPTLNISIRASCFLEALHEQWSTMDVYNKSIPDLMKCSNDKSSEGDTLCEED